MPVTFSPSSHPDCKPPKDGFVASPYQGKVLQETAATGLSGLYKKFNPASAELLQSSIQPKGDLVFGTVNGNSFLTTVMHAYSTHHALIIRPDDVWIAILTQFNFFVNGNAELLRSKFVNHNGKKELEVKDVGTRYSVDFGKLAQRFIGLIRKNINDAELCDWILPSFTTTTDNDTTVSAILMMSTLQAYFSYTISIACGLPKVTLEGEKKDWEDILSRVEKLCKYGEESTAWRNLLVPVLSRFVRAFDSPNSLENLDFWGRIYSEEHMGSGMDYMSGWITAFCVFNDKGEWMGHPINQELHRWPHEDGGLALDGVHYHSLSFKNIPCSHGNVPVKLNDNGEIFQTTMVAGLVATRVSSSGDTTFSKTGTNDIVQPVSGWWMFIDSAAE